jgi:hypothetical protein
MKLKEYRETYSLAQNAPYQIDDDASEGTPWSGGVLNAGPVVFRSTSRGQEAQWFCFGLRRGNRRHLGRLSVPIRALKIDLGKAPSN